MYADTVSVPLPAVEVIKEQIRIPIPSPDSFVYDGEVHSNRLTAESGVISGGNDTGRDAGEYEISYSIADCDTYADQAGTIPLYCWEDGTAGTVTRRYSILPADMTKASVEPVPDGLYTGVLPEPELVVFLGGIRLSEGTDFVRESTENVPGPGDTDGVVNTITLTGTGNYQGILTVSWRLMPAALTEVPIPEVSDQVYTGSAVSAAVYGTVGDLSAKEYMTVTGTESASAPGEYMVTFTLKDPEKSVWSDGTADPVTAEWMLYVCHSAETRYSALQTALDTETEIILDSDLIGAWTVHSDVTLDLNGHTLTSPEEASDGTTDGASGASEEVVLTLAAGTLTLTGDGVIISDGTAVKGAGGNLNLQGGSIFGAEAGILWTKGTLRTYEGQIGGATGLHMTDGTVYHDGGVIYSVGAEGADSVGVWVENGYYEPDGGSVYAMSPYGNAVGVRVTGGNVQLNGGETCAQHENGGMAVALLIEGGTCDSIGGAYRAGTSGEGYAVRLSGGSINVSSSTFEIRAGKATGAWSTKSKLKVSVSGTRNRLYLYGDSTRTSGTAWSKTPTVSANASAGGDYTVIPTSFSLQSP